MTGLVCEVRGALLWPLVACCSLTSPRLSPSWPGVQETCHRIQSSVIKRMSVMAGLGSLITSGSIVHNTNNNDTEKDDTVSFRLHSVGCIWCLKTQHHTIVYPNVLRCSKLLNHMLQTLIKIPLNVLKCPIIAVLPPMDSTP